MYRWDYVCMGVHDRATDVNAKPPEPKVTLEELDEQEELDESLSWVNIRPRLAYDASRKLWVDPQTLPEDARIEGLSAQLNESRLTIVPLTLAFRV